MDFGEFLKLLYSARNRFETIQMEWVYAYDENTLREIFDNQNDGSWTLLESVNAKRLNLPNDKSNFSFVHQKLLLDKQYFLRYERQIDENKPTIWIIADKREWHITFSKYGKKRLRYVEKDDSANVIDEISEVQVGELIDPSFLLSSHDILILGEERYLNRAVIEVQVIPRKGKEHGRESYFWHATDEIRLLVDKQHGTLLRYGLKLNDVEFAYSTISKIVFDAVIPESSFLAGIE